MKKRIVVICPGRGSYTKDNLGYLSSCNNKTKEFIKDIDRRRLKIKEPIISELDSAEEFKTSIHTKGEHASPLIYACSYRDFQLIDSAKYEIVAITGNSMGWYLTLAFSGVLDWAGAFELIQTMGSMMKEKRIGGQIIYPVVNENWHHDTQKEAGLLECLKEVNESGEEAHVSINLGGYRVIGGTSKALSALMKIIPRDGDYPFQLINNGAFHTPLFKEVSQKAFERISSEHFQKPKVPIIDGRGKVWSPYSTNLNDLYDYTLNHQVVKPYDFTKAITVALKEFAPDHLFLLGPGSSLGGSIGQILVENQWKGVGSKEDFKKLQKESLFLKVAEDWVSE